jgi:hypothetical protein
MHLRTIERNLSLPFTDDKGFAVAIHGGLVAVNNPNPAVSPLI